VLIRIDLSVRRLLLSAGSPILHANSVGDTCLILAARSGRFPLVKLLVEHGADARQPNHEGRIPLHFACENGYKAIVQYFLSSAISPPLDINTADHAGWTSLHQACLGGFPEHESHTGIVELLLQRGAKVDLADGIGMQPIHVCTDTSALRLLLAAGADPMTRDADGRTPLHLLSTDNCVVLLELPTPVDLHARDHRQRTPLHLTAEPDKARLLMKKGADSNALDQDQKVRGISQRCSCDMRDLFT
jgi:ankyrin repeat protein